MKVVRPYGIERLPFLNLQESSSFFHSYGHKVRLTRKLSWKGKFYGLFGVFSMYYILCMESVRFRDPRTKVCFLYKT